MKYILYGKLHSLAKMALGKRKRLDYRFVNVSEADLENNCLKISKSDNCSFFNEQKIDEGTISKQRLFPVENVVKKDSFNRLESSFKKMPCSTNKADSSSNIVELWRLFINSSIIPKGYRNEGLCYAGYILDSGNWCLPSWIWTNAAIVRMNCRCGDMNEARRISEALIALQRPDGGWIVRFDYDNKGAIPVLAPNDSAYIANNAFLEMYIATKETQYLHAAERCAKWIMDGARSDGMVYSGFDMRTQKWQTKHNIVDVGFTGALFSRLYEITGDELYLGFLKRFIAKYIELFYITNKGFATSLDEKDRPMGGMFGRGQAWALEGLIPYYSLNHDETVKNVIDSTINTLLHEQTKDGGWPYNLTRKMMGIDCKASSVIALNLLRWYEIHPERKDCFQAATRALSWCERHTNRIGQGKGGIFSFCIEGAIVHSMYTTTAFVYSSAYAIELAEGLHRRFR